MYLFWVFWVVQCQGNSRLGRKGRGEGIIRRQLSTFSPNYSIVMVHVHVNLTGFRINHPEDMSLGMFVRAFPERLAEEERLTLKGESTIPWLESRQREESEPRTSIRLSMLSDYGCHVTHCRSLWLLQLPCHDGP